MVFSLVSAVQEKLGEMLDNDMRAIAEQIEQQTMKDKKEVSIYYVSKLVAIACVQECC